jgi:tetrapyrrole methylase family protein/MazG family protein
MSPKVNADKLQKSIAAVVETVHRLRAPNGCPWDRAQTHQTLRPYLIEEAYEALDTIDRVDSVESLKDEKIRVPFQEELGDVLMQVLLHSEMTSEVGAFDFADVAQGLNDKLIHRHPHVFGEAAAAENASEALKNWERIKAQEKAKKAQAGEVTSVLDGLPKGMPSLQRTERMIEKVSKVGFQWSDLSGPLAKVQEEFQELKSELEAAKPDAKRIEAELGDLLFSICNLAYMSKVHPEDALRGTLHRFESRFRFVERKLHEQGKKPEQSSLDEMDGLWNEAKIAEKGSVQK